MSKQKRGNISMQTLQTALCEKCRRVADSPCMRTPQNLEPRFLRSNYMPPETERSRLEDLLREGEQDIKQMEEDISVLRCKLDQLERAKNATEATTGQCRAALSAHRGIPVEMWEMIFSELCLSLHDYSFDIRHVSPFLGLLATTVSQVCSHWNVISKGMPSLWSTIDVNLDESAYNVAILLDAYLSRSKETPLKVRIRSLDPANDSSAPLAMRRTLSKHLHKCRELVMAVIWSGFIEDLPPIQGLTFPNLESYHDKYVTPDVWPWFWEAIHRRAPKLNMVSATFLDPNIPFSQLTA
ncbi:hypothetical protein L218DRAFT_297712 [Marasmius fiardii PR-910]|nr:hypothetical protein L218DRAFT_297712 [Marasmius fiardii PR-910]